MSIIEVNKVSIRYITGDFKDIGLKEYVMRKLTGNYRVSEFWADRDVSFSLEKGDMLGIIGTNGAGKSTLLKVVSGIMEPTKGWIKREGSISALLELASGFDGELTVKENAYLRGAMLGYTRKFMDETYEQIIDFAELKEFEDRPFKQLSSGMKSRLAFSIASLLQPDILILDEVLSVGDGAFRKKSEAKMREIIRGGATTILVSHSLTQIRELCNKILWLHKGQQIIFGDDVEEICDRYEQFLEGDAKALRTNPFREMVQAPVDCRDKELTLSLNGSSVLEDVFARHENHGGYRVLNADYGWNPLWGAAPPTEETADWFVFDLVNVVLTREGEVPPQTMTRPQLKERLEQFTEAILAQYPEKRILLLQTQYLSAYKTEVGFPAYSSSEADLVSRDLTKLCTEIVMELLPGMATVPLPGQLFGDPAHPRGFTSLGYDSAYYDYALKMLDAILLRNEDQKAQARLRKAYSAHFRDVRREVQKKLLEAKGAELAEERGGAEELSEE